MIFFASSLSLKSSLSAFPNSSNRKFATLGRNRESTHTISVVEIETIVYFLSKMPPCKMHGIVCFQRKLRFGKIFCGLSYYFVRSCVWIDGTCPRNYGQKPHGASKKIDIAVGVVGNFQVATAFHHFHWKSQTFCRRRNDWHTRSEERGNTQKNEKQ